MSGSAYRHAKAERFQRIFDQAAAELARADFEQCAIEDDPAHGLRELAEREHPELIVIGSIHHGSMRRTLGGTVAARLLHGAPCGLLVAPRGWSERQHSGIRVIGVGYDGGGESKIALAHAQELAKTIGAKLKVITIAPYFGVDAHVGPVVAMRQMWGETLDEGVKAISNDLATERVLRQGKEATELALAGAEVDLLVVGSRGYGPRRRALAGSVAAELLRSAPCPVLVIPRGSEDQVAAEALAAAA